MINKTGNNLIFDIVIPLGPNDNDLIYKVIELAKKNVIGYRNIYIVSYDDTVKIDGCINISEKLFPFSIETVAEFHGKLKRNGWYLQQLLKLYSGLIISDILDKYLIIDADVLFTKPIEFYQDGKALITYSHAGIHIPYFEHMKKLGSEFYRQISDKSGICHHMLFETKYIKEIFELVEKNHNDKFYSIFLKNVDSNYRSGYGSGASEYEIYFNYMILKHSDKITLRELKWEDLSEIKDSDKTLDYDYLTSHCYMRNTIFLLDKIV